MKAISLHQPRASLIAQGRKRIETRFWETKYRGPLVICSTLRPRVGDDFSYGKALCCVSVVDCRPMTVEEEEAAMVPVARGRYAWILEDLVRFPEPFPVRGRQGFFQVELPPELWKLVPEFRNQREFSF